MLAVEKDREQAGFGEMRQRDVVRDAARQHQSLLASLARHISKPLAPGRARAQPRERRTVQDDIMRAQRIGADDGAQKLALAGIGKAGDAEDLTLAQRE